MMHCGRMVRGIIVGWGSEPESKEGGKKMRHVWALVIAGKCCVVLGVRVLVERAARQNWDGEVIRRST